MSKENKHQGFLKGAAILSISTVIVKVLGLLFTIPIANTLDKSAYGYFTVAYDVFAVFNAAATAGLPVAVSRMVSGAYAKGQKKQADRIFGVALLAFFILGLVSSLVMFSFSDAIAAAMSYPRASLAIKALAPTVFFCAMMSAMRGYFQGRSNMTPTAISQVIEAVVKLVVGVGLAKLVVDVWQSSDSALAAAAAILGVSISAALGTIYLTIYKRRQTKRDLLDDDKGDETITRRKSILSSLVKFAVPITIGSCFLYVLNLIDTSIIGTQLQTISGVTEAIASGYNGYWGAAIKIFDLPGAIVIALSTSLLPVLTAAFVRGDERGMNTTAAMSLKFTFLVTVPCAVGFILYGNDIARLFYGGRPETAEGAGQLLTIAAIGVIFNGVLYTTNAIMQSLGHVVAPVVNMAIGGVVKIIMNYFLVGIPEINIYGAAISMVVSYLITMILNLIAVYKWMPNLKNPLASLWRTIAASVVMGAVSYGAFALLNIFAPRRLSVIVAIIVAVAIYVAFVLIFKAVSYEDVKMMPKGERIAALLKLKPTEVEE